MILEPPLSIGAGGRSPEKTSPGMVDRPSKRQGPGPACGEVDGGVLAWHGGFDRPSVRMRPEDDRAGRRYAHQPARRSQVLGLDTHALLLLPLSETLEAPLACEAEGVLRAGARYPRGEWVGLSWMVPLRAGCGQSSVARAYDLR